MNKTYLFPKNFLKTFRLTEQTVNRRLPHAAFCFIAAFRFISTHALIDQVMESALAFSRTNLRRDYFILVPGGF